jgi:hypothetical protein
MFVDGRIEYLTRRLVTVITRSKQTSCNVPPQFINSRSFQLYRRTGTGHGWDWCSGGTDNLVSSCDKPVDRQGCAHHGGDRRLAKSSSLHYHASR